MTSHASRRWLAALAVTTTFFSGAASSQGRPVQPGLDLGGETRGAAAVAALGRNLPAVAAAHRMSAERLQEILTRDSSARLDRNGRLLYVEPMATESAGDSVVIGQIEAYDPSQAFTLASKPGAAKVIYLDFDGHSLSGSAWNGGAAINAEPYDTDGNPGAFSTAERDAIHRIWQRVAEDYAPFDVNVTTADPGLDALRRTATSDASFGARVVITRNTFYNCSCGGVAYVGTYDYVSSTNPDRYQPAWVFFNALGNDANVAEAASHEAGHNLGLSHDGRSNPVEGYYRGHGTGVTGWAPIMGVGYGKSLTQWSRGEYAFADNLEDDLLVIAQNGLAASVDAVGGTPAAAALLAGTATGSSVLVAQDGNIESAADRDVFRFVAGAGALSLTASAVPVGANVDLALDLLDASGNVIASSNPADGIGASIAVTVAAGTYFVRVDGVGKGDPTTGYSDYGSLGRYTISGSYAASSAVTPVAPVAAFAVSTATGIAPLPVNFDASGSSDSDGAIVSYQWAFGDGTSGTGQTIGKTYGSAGSYTATLTVTDDSGLSASTSRQITVTAPALPALSVPQVSVSASQVKRNYRCTAEVTVVSNGVAVSGATVSGNWAGTVSGGASGVTAGSGLATISSGQTKKRGTCTFTVNGVSANGYTYSAPNPPPSGSVSY